MIEPEVFSDTRGYFYESFNLKKFKSKLNVECDFVQDNHSRSRYGVLRGLHIQKEPVSQGKLVRVINGKVFDVAVDLRKNSKTYGMYVSEYLSSENNKQLWIPPGFAHGFLVLSDYADFLYKTTNYYSPTHERTILYNDKNINIDWPINENKLLVNTRDLSGLSLNDFEKSL